MQREDEDILSLAASGHTNEAFQQLVQRYQERLYWHIRQLVIAHDDTDDILQDTLIKAWKHLADFRGDSSLYTWLYRIATNEALNALKKKRRRTLVPWGDASNELSRTLESDPYFSGDDIQRKLQKAILQLPDKQRAVFSMRYYDDIPYQKMADILQTSEGALKASYHHAVKKIERYMNNHAQ